MAAPPPPPPPPTLKAPPPKAKGGGGLASLLANSHLTTGDTGSTDYASGNLNPADVAQDHNRYEPRASRQSIPVDMSSSKGKGGGGRKTGDTFMDELRNRLGTPVDYESSPVEYNPSMSRPGYRPPANLPQGGTQGEEKVFYQIKGPQVAKVQSLVSYQLFCRNEAKQMVDLDMAILEAEMISDKDKADVSKGIFSKVGKGEFKLSFRGRNVGKYHFNIYVRGRMEKKAIYQPPGVELELIATDTLVKQTTLFTVSGYGFQGGKVGKVLIFEILSRSEQGQPIDCEMERLKVVVSQGLKKVQGEISRVELGKYRAAFKPFGPGECIITVEYGGQEVCMNKAEFHMGIDSSKTELVNPPRHVLIGQENRFIIQARDSEGNEVPTGGERFDVACSGPAKGITGLVVRDELNGKYTVRFTCVLGGTFKFFISLNGVDIRGTPLEFDAK